MKKIAFLLFILLPSSLYAGWLWGPSNSEECIAENIKNTSNERAAKTIIYACRGLFPEPRYKNFGQCVEEKQNDKLAREREEERVEREEREKEERLLREKQLRGEWVSPLPFLRRGVSIPRFRSSIFINPEEDCKSYFPTSQRKKYYRCLLKELKGASTDIAAKVIIGQCESKYPDR